MRLVMKTPVAQPRHHVFAQFNRSLFERLAPPFPKATLLRYDGEQPGHIVSIRLCLGPFCQVWTSRITHNQQGPQLSEFVDEGTQLPFFLREWEHRHIVAEAPKGAGSVIIDDVRFATPPWLPALFVWPAVWAMFALRKPVYRNIFNVR